MLILYVQLVFVKLLFAICFIELDRYVEMINLRKYDDFRILE